MRDTPLPPSGRPEAAPSSSTPIQAAGHRSGEGSASVLEHLVQERVRGSQKPAPQRPAKEPRA